MRAARVCGTVGLLVGICASWGLGGANGLRWLVVRVGTLGMVSGYLFRLYPTTWWLARYAAFSRFSFRQVGVGW